MSFADFQASLQQSTVPADLSSALQGLWHEGKGQWDRAHQCVQEDSSPAGAWVHAYLHRKEKDAGNAAYWYARAGRAVATAPLAEEWATIARALLGD